MRESVEELIHNLTLERNLLQEDIDKIRILLDTFQIRGEASWAVK